MRWAPLVHALGAGNTFRGKSMTFHPVRTLLLVSLLLLAGAAQAAGAGMPWEAPLQRILDSLTGPVAKMISVSAIVVTGLSIAFGEGGAGMKKLLWIVFGISMAFGASSFFLGFFGFAGGVGF
jgi:type IV secretory pathway VirB2 component (pilin)